MSTIFYTFLHYSTTIHVQNALLMQRVDEGRGKLPAVKEILDVNCLFYSVMEQFEKGH